MRSLNNTEKIKFYVPESTDRIIRSDAEQFEIYKPNGEQVNLNRFLSLLIVGYYAEYKQEINEATETIRELIGTHLHINKQREELTRKLVEHVIFPETHKRKGIRSIPMSLKPTYDTDRIITEISQSIVGTDDYISQYLRRMLMSYCSKPVYERERIIFRDNVEFLEEACGTQREISFTTTINPQIVRHVIPYKLVYGTEERFNYLLGQEYNAHLKKNVAISFRLCRINRPAFSLSSGVLEDSVRKYLDLTGKNGPQYAMNEEIETCVRLSEKGEQSFRMIYFGRPIVSRKEKEKDGSMLYYFYSSTDQLFRYFLRFNPGEAEILYPEKLRIKLRKFYESALSLYKKHNRNSTADSKTEGNMKVK